MTRYDIYDMIRYIC